jgi:flagellar hook-associated protein 1 FlgK
MSSLFGLLRLGSNALGAQNAGIAVAANNVANVGTEGYSRQRIDLQSNRASPLVGGVRAVGVDRMSSDLLAGRIRSNNSSVSIADAFAGALLDLEAQMTASGDLGGRVAGFFASMGEVSAAPTDVNMRDAAVRAARALAVGMQEQAAVVADARVQANVRIRENLAEANQYIQEIAAANRAAHSDDPTIQDRRDLASQRLSELVGASARIDPDGQMRVTMSDGAVLVDGTRAAQLQSTPDEALGGMDRIDVVDGNLRRDVTASFDGGRVGGELRMRDETAPAALAQLDQLAFDLSSRVNDVHRQNAGTDGVTGRDIFVQPTQVAGAAAAMAVDPALLADSSRLATAAPGTGPGDNGGALAMLGLADQPLADGGRRTFADAGIEIGAGIGRSAAEAASDSDFFSAQGQHLAGLRDSMSGVSLQEEMSNLSQFQHAAEAQLQFISTVDQLLGSIIEGL